MRLEEIEINEIREKLNAYYGNIMNEQYCEAVCEALRSLLDPSSQYRKPIIEWKNGKTAITEVTIPKGSNETWKLSEVAARLNPEHPNVPIAAFLFFLSEETPVTISVILSIAEKYCLTDPVLIDSDSLDCALAFIDEDDGEWIFLAKDTDPETLRPYQLWQVLLQHPALALPVSYDFEPGSGYSIQLWDDGVYHIVPPDTSGNGEPL